MILNGQLQMALIFVVSAAVGIPTVAQTARQGDPNVPVQSTDFRSPMILDTVFAAADRSLWGTGGWFTVDDYIALGKFTCDGVSLRNDYKASKGTWGPGLELAVKPADEGHVRVKIRAIVHNPRHNHDKFVNLFFEVFNGDDLVESARMPPIKAQDDADEVDKEVALLISIDALKTSPMTKLRITMITVDD